VLCFIGSAACNPVFHGLLAKYYDPRFFFSEWNESLVDRLLQQQEVLKSEGVERQVLILVDDIIMTSAAADQLAHMGMRGRHFNVSCVTCSVSYTTLPKRFRRSLDVLMVFSCPMSGDMQILTYEFARLANTARFFLSNMEEHSCLVMETLTKNQQLFSWKANLITLESLRESEESSESSGSETGATAARSSADPAPPRQKDSSAVPDRTGDLEDGCTAAESATVEQC